MKPTNNGKLLVTFWGTRGSISTPGRITEKYGGNTPCVSVRYQDIHIIFDAGTGIRNLGLELIEEFKKEGNSIPLHLFLSHTHWDHIQGFPFFEPSYEKDTKLTIYGSPHKERFLDSILEGQMDSDYFPVSMSEIEADISIKEISENIISFGPLILDWQEQIYHPGGSVRYRLSINGKKIVYATDVELDRMFNATDDSDENISPTQDYINFVYNADLLIADGQYTEEEYTDKVGWGHSSIPVILDLAHQAQVKQLAIFHHDPQHSDKFLDKLWIENRSKYRLKDRRMEIFWAREGMTIAV
jgi:phosphoribosyl 1,2-cyclic phosphodiesterase